MRMAVNGAEIPLGQVTYRGLGFGERPGERSLQTFALRMSVDELRAAVEPAFDTFSSESKEDDAKHGGATTVAELVGLRYAGFAEAMRRDRVLVAKIVQKYLFLELLDALFGENDPGRCVCAVNSLESVVVDELEATIGGTSYRL